MGDDLKIYDKGDNRLTFSMSIETDLYKELDGKVEKPLIDNIELYKELETMHMIQSESGNSLKEKIENFENKISKSNGKTKKVDTINSNLQRYKLKYKY